MVDEVLTGVDKRSLVPVLPELIARTVRPAVQQLRFEVRADVDSPQLVADQRAESEFDGRKGRERRCAKVLVEAIQLDDVVQPCAGVELISSRLPSDLSEGIPVPTEPVAVHTAQVILGSLMVAHVHASGLEQSDLLRVGLEWLGLHCYRT